MIESQVVEVSFITDTLNTWCIDSGTTNISIIRCRGSDQLESAVMGKSH